MNIVKHITFFDLSLGKLRSKLGKFTEAATIQEHHVN